VQTIYKRFSVVIGFGLLVLVLLFNALVTRRQLAVQTENQVWLTRSRQVLLALTRTESVLKDAETGQRGFLYTNDPKYLAPYNSATGQVDAEIDKLAHLTAEDSTEQARIPMLRSLAHQKLAELAQTISLYQSGKPEAAKALVLSDVGLVKMDQIRALIDEMTQHEASIEAVRSAAYQKSVRITVGCIYLASLIAALGAIFLAYFILREMALREQHARQILEREEWFRVTLTSLGDAVIATDKLGRVTFLNPLAEDLTGRKLAEALGKPIEQVFPIFNESTHKPVENPIKKVLEEGRIVGLANHTVLQHVQGKITPIEDSASPIRDAQHEVIGVVLVFRDATIERKTQEVLRRTEKLAAAARLSATVAHEINNPLEAIGNLLYIAKGVADLPRAAKESLTLAEQELERVSHITRQTLGFYRESTVPDQVDLSVLIESVLKIYSNKLERKSITVHRNFGDCPPIVGLSGELRQALSNLISNAADAVSDYGTIHVALRCVESVDGKHAHVLIEDDGPGIDPLHVDRIFEPFFTTKKDVGTGLGLWVTKEIVDRHGGTIEVSSRADKSLTGTVFQMLLPCSPESLGA
jgi:PAS domain S-box-containing protein